MELLNDEELQAYRLQLGKEIDLLLSKLLAADTEVRTRQAITTDAETA